MSTYADSDPELTDFASSHGLHVYTSDRGVDVRSVDVVDDSGCIYHLWLSPSPDGEMAVVTSDSTNRQARFEEGPIRQRLEAAYGSVEKWIREDGHTRTPVMPQSLTSDIVLPLEGSTVTICAIDYAFNLHLVGDHASFDLRIEQPFVIRSIDGSRQIFAPTDCENCTELGPALTVLFKAVARGVASRGGSVSIEFTDGTVLVVEPHSQYEAWTFNGDDGRLIVSMPGGGLAVWPAKNSPTTES